MPEKRLAIGFWPLAIQSLQQLTIREIPSSFPKAKG